MGLGVQRDPEYQVIMFDSLSCEHYQIYQNLSIYQNDIIWMIDSLDSSAFHGFSAWGSRGTMCVAVVDAQQRAVEWHRERVMVGGQWTSGIKSGVDKMVAIRRD